MAEQPVLLRLKELESLKEIASRIQEVRADRPVFVTVVGHGRAVCGARGDEYDLRMQKARVTVTVRRDVLAKAERQVRRGRAKSVSAWVDAAMEEKARREDLAALLTEMKAENGPPTAKEEAWARAVLGL
jgi:hypothetical protein